MILQIAQSQQMGGGFKTYYTTNICDLKWGAAMKSWTPYTIGCNIITCSNPLHRRYQLQNVFAKCSHMLIFF